MSVGFEDDFPETVGLSAAQSGFGLIEAAFLPVPRLIGPASLWPVAVSFFGAVAVAVAAGMTIGDDVSPLSLNSGVSPIVVGGPPSLQRQHLSCLRHGLGWKRGQARIRQCRPWYCGGSRRPKSAGTFSQESLPCGGQADAEGDTCS